MAHSRPSAPSQPAHARPRTATEPAHYRPLRAKPRSNKRPVGYLLALALVGGALFAATWVGARAWFAKGELEQAQAMVTSVKDRLTAGEYGGLRDTFAAVQVHTVKARGLTEDPLWSLTEHVPVLGPNLRALRQLTAVVDDTMTAAQPLADLGNQLTPASLAPKDGAIPLAPFETAATAVPAAATDFAAIQARLADVSTAGTLSQVRAAKTTLVDLLDTATSALEQATPIVQQLPALLGANGPRTYVVMFLNSAELRALGGTALSFAEISVDHGAIEFKRTVPAGNGNFPIRKTPVIPLPDDVESIYSGTLGQFIANATVRPDAVTAAKIVDAEWQAKYGTPVDGVISMDGGALSLLLQAVGPVKISTGDVVSADNVQKLLLNEVYQRYNTGISAVDNAAQNKVYADTVSATFAKLTSGSFDPITLVDSMSTAAKQHRFSVWFPNDQEESAIADTPFAARGLPTSTSSADVVGVYLKNASWSKLDYYLKPAITTATAACTADGREVHRVTLSLTNTLKPAEAPGLSPSIVGGWERLGLTKGEQQYVVYFYLPKGATLLSGRSNETQQDLLVGHDGGHDVKAIWVKVPPGATSTVSVDMLMANPGDKPVTTDVTPTIQPLTTGTEQLDCSTVTLP
ncbi:DUF4012 domain-containing protein [Isoptericola sp. b490]|uniref:DUF4012 domain-containing protein n=1 Tax=Actinotalea lenta TaxID=3064654 RepID=UPI00271257D6|nr:DUF4012 domain-containing protein [Isoptericola sp. b490]MDO8119910.1 DUF4012 domain-containing protein [Isoptericola sp. b490]